MRVDDDDEMDELAEAQMRREGLMPLPELCKKVTELAPVVVEQAEEIKKLKAKAEKRKVWNWWTATDEQKAEWIAQIELWLTDYLFRFFPQMANRKHVPECWKLHPDWLEYLGTLYRHGR